MTTLLIAVAGAALVWGIIEWLIVGPESHSTAAELKQSNETDRDSSILFQSSQLAVWGPKNTDEILKADPALKQTLDKVEVALERPS